MEQKFIDKEGLKTLWRQTSLQDYPNNETLVAVISAIDETKADKSDLTSHTGNTSNPHSVTYSQLGLSLETWKFTLEDGSTVTKKVVVQ